MLLSIVTYPDRRLAIPSHPVTEVTDELRTLAANMAETMYEAEGIGLAAPQVGVHLQLIVVDTSGPEKREALEVYVNPVLTLSIETTDSDEGCLSVPGGYRSKVKRAARVHLSAQDLDGNPIERDLEGTEAVCLQHETDHLKGVLFIDHISSLKRSLYDAKLRKFMKK